MSGFVAISFVIKIARSLENIEYFQLILFVAVYSCSVNNSTTIVESGIIVAFVALCTSRQPRPAKAAKNTESTAPIRFPPRPAT